MSIEVRFPEMPRTEGSISMFRTPPPVWDDESVKATMARFGVEAEARPAGQFVIARDRRSVLEIYQASDSVRWGLRSYDSEGRGRASGRPPEEGEALEIALAFLEETGLADARAQFHSLGRTEIVDADREHGETARTVAVHVNFRFEMAGLPVLGPGAKMQVTIDGARRVVEAYKFWREPVEGEALEVVPPGRAAALLEQDGMFADLSDETARVAIERVELGYYAFPPMDAQGMLLPVYAFTGVISTPLLERYEFTKRVLAVDLSADAAKRSGTSSRPLQPVF